MDYLGNALTVDRLLTNVGFCAIMVWRINVNGVTMTASDFWWSIVVIAFAWSPLVVHGVMCLVDTWI